MKKVDNPYPECDLCKTLDDCKHAEKAEGLSSAMPPDNCPIPIRIMRHSLHKRKLERYKKLS